MAGIGVAVTSGDLTPLLDDNGSGVYVKGRNSQRDIRVGLIGSSFLVGSDGFTPRLGVLPRTADSSDLKVVSQLTPNQTVTVKKGMAVIPRTGQGAYLFVNEADQIVNMPAASAVNPRYDIVCCAAFDKGSFVGDTAHGPQFWVESGVVSGSPVVPATPAGMLKLSEHLRAVNDNTIGGGAENVDKRISTSLHVPARVLLPGDSASDPGLTLGEVRYGGTGPEFWNGTVWQPVGRNSFANIAAIPASLAVTNMLVYHAGLQRMIRYNGTNWDQNYDLSVERVFIGGKMYATGMSNTTSGTTERLTGTDTGSIAFVAGFTYELEFGWNSNQSVNNDSFLFAIRDTNIGGAILHQQMVKVDGTSVAVPDWTYCKVPYRCTSTGAKTFVTTIKRIGGSGTITITDGVGTYALVSRLAPNANVTVV